MLQIWMPLNGNANNCGILDSAEITTVSSPAFTIGGIGGKTLSSGGFKMTEKASSQILNNKAISIAFWIYPNVDSGSSGGGIIFGNENMTAPNNRKFSLFQYPTVNDLHWSWQNNESNKTFCSGVLTGILPSYTWTHICVTYENPNYTFYVNGEKIKTGTGVSSSDSFAFTTSLISNKTNRYIGDFRLYDHCLSPVEVSNISMGLAIHYPLNDPYPTMAINKYKGESYDGKASSKSSQFTMTQLTDERGYNYKLSYTGTGSNAWFTISFPSVDFTSEKKYKFSCKVRKHIATSSFNIRAARVQNDWETINTNILSANDEEWHEVYVIATMPKTYTRSGTTYNVSPRVEFYSPSLSENEKIYKYDFDLKDIQISECESSVASTNANWNDNVIYDTSGYSNHGLVIENNRPYWSSPSPRYNGCYQFIPEQQIRKIPNPINITNPNFSISFWVKFSSEATQTIYTARTVVGSGIALFFISKNFRLDDGEQAVFNNYTIPQNVWLHVVVVRDSNYKKLYVNGELKQTATSGKFSNVGSYGTIGASESSDTGIGSGNYLSGQLSDFRLYGTALSAEKVKQLYQVPEILSSSGSMIIQGEIIE